MRPRCCLRNLTFFGINIISSQLPVLGSQSCDSQPCCLLIGRLRLATGNRLRQLSLERVLRLSFATLLRKDLAFVDPALHADDAVRGLRFRESPVDVGAKGVQRQTTLQIPLGARDFVSVQAARNANLDSLAAKAQSRIHRLTHGAAETNTLFELQRDVLGDQLCIELRLVHFLYVDEYF